MILLGICDDEEIHRENIRNLCELYFKENPQEHEYIEFSSGEEVFKYKGDKIHLLFLDVEMGEVDGIQVLNYVQDAEWVWRVVFVSSHEEAVWKSFSIKTLEFARKPVQYNQIAKWIEIAIRENKEDIIFEYVTPQGKMYKTINEIYYMEASGNYTYLGEKNEKYLINNNLKSWQEKMKNVPIIRVHKTYLINLLHVKKWEAEKVILDNDIEFPIGRAYYKSAKEVYFNFVKKKAFERM